MLSNKQVNRVIGWPNGYIGCNFFPVFPAVQIIAAAVDAIANVNEVLDGYLNPEEKRYFIKLVMWAIAWAIRRLSR